MVGTKKKLHASNQGPQEKVYKSLSFFETGIQRAYEGSPRVDWSIGKLHTKNEGLN